MGAPVWFSRWEYQEKNIFCTEGLWTLNSDRTPRVLFCGNTLTVPTAIYTAKQIPGTRKVLCVIAAYHHPPPGHRPKASAVVQPRVPRTFGCHDALDPPGQAGRRVHRENLAGFS